MNIIIQSPKLTRSSVLFFPHPKNVSPQIHWSSPDHSAILDVITDSIFVEEHKLCFYWGCRYFVAFQILCIKVSARIQIFISFSKFYQRMLPHLLKFYQGLIFYCIYGGSTEDWNVITFVKALLNIQILQFVMNLSRIQILPHLWSYAKDFCLYVDIYGFISGVTEECWF